MVDEKNGEGGKGGGENNVTELQATVASLKGQIGEIDKAKEALADKVGDYEKTFMSKEWLDFVDTQKGGEGEDEGEGEETPKDRGKMDLNNLNPTQLAEHLSKSFGVALGKITSVSDKKFEDIQTVLVQQLSRVNLELTKSADDTVAAKEGRSSLRDMLGPKEGKTDEQQKYYDHYFGVAKVNPAWDGEQVRKQVAMEDDASAHAAQKAESVKVELESKARTERASDASLSTVDDKDLTAEEAVELAYKETMSNTAPTE